MNPPIAKIDAKILEAHNHKRTDNYYWMNERENPDTISYLEAENAYSEEKLKHTEEFQTQLFEEIKARIKKDDESVPYKIGEYLYYSRYDFGLEYPIFGRKKVGKELDLTKLATIADSLKEEIILNVNELAEGQPYCNVSNSKVSTNHQILCFSTDFVGRRIYDLQFKNLETGEILADKIADVTGSFVWANDNKTIFYTKQDEQTMRPFQLWRHVLGTEISQDELVFTEENETFWLGVGKDKQKGFINIISNATVSSEMWFLDANKPEGKFQILQPRERDLEYFVDYFDGDFYILTNWKAKNFRLMKTAVSKPGKENWEEVIAHRDDVLLENVEIFNKFLVLEERQGGLTQIRIIEWKDRSEHYLAFGEPTYTSGIGYNPDSDTEWLRFSYNSLTTPNSVFDYQMETHEKILQKQQPVLGEFSADDYQSERIFATAEDGTKVAISLVYKKGVEKDGNNPLYLTAYGSYGMSYDPYFSTVRLSLLNRGFIFAIAHIRGGQEMGRAWYEDGKLLNKQNTFDDFISCSEYLISEKFTHSTQLVINGGSAGGLLMGAVVNKRPDLFKAVVADVAFVDVVTTMLDESIPLTTGEFDEWGNPKIKEFYDYMLSYSPYDNVEAQEYPSMLVTSGLHDSQVQYWEPTKWVAKLRTLKTDSNPLLLVTNMDAGHGGSSGRFERLKEIAREYAFLIDILGMDLK
jgi:oligopeptidase B